MASEETVTWLLDTDPALRWQVERDLVGEPASVWTATRARVATEGFGARLLAAQDADGQWAGGAFLPADVRERGLPGEERDTQPWTATTWSLNALREWGLDPAALAGTAERLSASCRWEYQDLPYWSGEIDVCINSYTLANGMWLGVDDDAMSALAGWFVEHRRPDGGWNCAWEEGRPGCAGRSSLHSTLNALDGLLAFESATGGTDASRAARRGGTEYLVERGLFRRRSTGEPVGPWVGWFSYPGRWRYSVLRALDHLRRAADRDDTVRLDPRLDEAVALVRSARRPEGTWLQGPTLPGRVWFPVDVSEGEPSPWLTLIATRVLAWSDGRTGPAREPDLA